MPFTDEDTTARRFRRLVKAIPVALLLPSVIYFWKEIRDILSVPGWLLSFLLGNQPPPLPATLGHSFWVLAFTLVVGFWLTYRLWLYLFAWQAWLPVVSFREIQQTASHFQLFVQGEHGPAVFVKDGQLIATKDEIRRARPGVLVVDYNSAVVLERGVPRPRYPGPLVELVKDIYMIPRKERPRTRICGPGIAFIGYNERIYGVADLISNPKLDEISGVVDLRSQFRMNEKWLGKEPPPSVTHIHCYTRDGIELKTSVWAIFSIGQDPEVIHVTYRGKRRLENLCVVNLEDKPGDLVRVKGFGDRDELDEEDYLEIHREVSRLRLPDEYSNYQALSSSEGKSGELKKSAPLFDPNRVFSAVYSTARTSNDTVIPWVYLPSHVAIDMFREIMSRFNYDDLYAIDQGQPQLPDAQKQLRFQMRANGLLSYRLILHCDQVELEKDKEYEKKDLIVSSKEGKPLTTSKVLRDRGIKVITAGFGDLIPVANEVYQQRVDNWRATWETDTAIAAAGYELEAMRIRNRARVQAQQELFYSFSQLFNRRENTNEILAIHIFQTLEKLAADPRTCKLLTGDTINLLRTVHDWLLPPGSMPPSG